MTQRPFAAFDIDGTLVRWQFFHAIVNELGKAKLLDEATDKAIRAARLRWKKREQPESFRDYELTLVQGYFDALTRISQNDHAVVIQKVFDEYRDQLFTYTRGLLKELKSQGYLIFAISGSHEAIIAKMASYLGIDDFMGGAPELKDGAYTGNWTTPITDKAAALRQLAHKHQATFDRSIAVGDSESDRAMLEIVDTAIAFNPSKGLYESARKQGWKIVVERKNTIYELESIDGTYVLA